MLNEHMLCVCMNAVGMFLILSVVLFANALSLGECLLGRKGGICSGAGGAAGSHWLEVLPGKRGGPGFGCQLVNVRIGMLRTAKIKCLPLL